MDGVTPFVPNEGRRDMPPPAPLALYVQNLRSAIRHEASPTAPGSWKWRALVFGSTFGVTLSVLALMQGYFGGTGYSLGKLALLALVGLTFSWIVLSVASVGAAVLARLVQAHPGPRRPARTAPLSTALLVPIYNESPAAVFGNAAAMLADLDARKGAHQFSLFILSDSRSPAIAEQEWQAFTWLRAIAPPGIAVHYRRRNENTDKKTGNLAEWIRTWGGAYDAMLVLDADSLMTGGAIRTLADEMAQDPSVGLIQSFPGLIGAETLFGRMQQFSSATYSWLLAEGLALWTKNEGNYWGHNAIVRTRAFAASAGLPHLRGWRGQSKVILSHDFVEAGLLRRAGWSVRFLAVPGSFEETPATLVDYILRDRRWCQGNLQHLRLLNTRGLHPLSRFHLFFGAISYLMSPAWLILLTAWAVLGVTEIVPQSYFSPANPLYPVWPELSATQGFAVLLFMYGMLLLPKLTAATMIAATPGAVARYGGALAFWGGVTVEVVVSVFYAPVMMIQQSLAVARGVLGRSAQWAPQSRTAVAIPLRDLVRFHCVETILGVGLTAGIATGVFSLWLAPIAVSLVLAVPLSALSAVDITKSRLKFGRLDTPNSLREPAIWRRARRARSEVARYLDEDPMPTSERVMAAE